MDLMTVLAYLLGLAWLVVLAIGSIVWLRVGLRWLELHPSPALANVHKERLEAQHDRHMRKLADIKQAGKGLTAFEQNALDEWLANGGK